MHVKIQNKLIFISVYTVKSHTLLFIGDRVFFLLIFSFEMYCIKFEDKIEIPWTVKPTNKIQLIKLKVFTRSMNDIKKSIRKLRKKHESPLLSEKSFINGFSNYEPNHEENYWKIKMRSYNIDGTWFGTRCELAVCPPQFALDDFFKYYTAKFHWLCFESVTHGNINIVYASRVYDRIQYPILFFKTTGKKFEEARNSLKALHCQAGE